MLMLVLMSCYYSSGLSEYYSVRVFTVHPEGPQLDRGFMLVGGSGMILAACAAAFRLSCHISYLVPLSLSVGLELFVTILLSTLVPGTLQFHQRLVL